MASRAFMGALVLIVLALMGGVALLRQRAGQEFAAATLSPGGEAASAPREEVRDKGLLGVIVADESVDLAARTEGRVESVRVQVGSAVRQGEVIATLDATATKQELAITEATLLSSRAELQVAELSLKQSEERLKRREAPEQLALGAISEEEVSAARYEQLMAQAKREMAEAHVKEQEARVAQLRQRVEEMVLRAPFDGVVAGRFVHPGALLQAGRPVVHLLRRGKPQVRFAIPSQRPQRVEVGQAVHVEVAERSLALEGRVMQVAPEVDVASLMVFALADVEMPQGGALPAGTTVRVKLLPQEKRASNQ